jgi:hypothetical protein
MAVVHPVPVGLEFRRFGKIQKCTFLIYRKLHKANINIEVQYLLFSTFTREKEPDIRHSRNTNGYIYPLRRFITDDRKNKQQRYNLNF